MFDARKYLERINFAGSVTASKDCLEGLHLAHLAAVPYENFDIIKRLNLRLDEESLFQKIVVQNRGGFCYELNFLFARLLRELGFQVELLSARIFNEDDSLGPEYDHPILLVKLQERWLADVGNSRWFHTPISLEQPNNQMRNGVIYRIEKCGDYYTLLRHNAGGDGRRQYRFTLKPRQESEFGKMCLYKWTSPESRFTKGYIFARVISENERLILTETKFISTRNGFREERLLNSKTEFTDLLTEYFSEVYQKLMSAD